MQELRTLLAETIEMQAKFIAQRIERTLPTLSEKLSPTDRVQVKKQFFRVAQTSMGMYALIDYVNFKGEGINPKESYKGKGWGLVQVLQNMSGNTANPMEEFVAAAKKVLKQRVDNAPPDRNEQRWLKGWYNRLDTYLTANKWAKVKKLTHPG